ncbi:hypothetical protein ACFQGE_18750 [Halomicroarcula sp. GCM10025817]|uniref:hypothetical protein n=1 Tax=Haloarcula TaxID=2237 RepID=UPI0023E7607B|nr:hypothetical protein [Halomicroarcula sp. SYNS111]
MSNSTEWTTEDLRGYIEYIEEDLDDIGEYIMDQYNMDYSNREEHWAYFAAAVHNYLRTQVSYYDQHDGYRRPRTTWEHGGRCGDQCILAASIFSSYGYPWRIVNVESPQYDRIHALLEVGFPEEKGLSESGVRDGLAKFYQANPVDHGRISRNYAWKDIMFYPMDTEYSDWVGGIQNLVDSGFAEQYSDGTWGWTKHRRNLDAAFDGHRTFIGEEIYS